MTSDQPATEKGRATRDRIIRAAAELVVERGVAGTSIDDVCARARVSKSQLYHYFTDRNALMRAVARAAADDVLAGQAELFTQLDTIDGLRAWTDALVTLQQTRDARGGCQIGSLGGQLAERDDDARLELAGGLDRWEGAISAGLQRMQARGELRPDADPATLAQRTLAAAQGGLLLTQIRRDPNQLRSALNGALDAIVTACAAPWDPRIPRLAPLTRRCPWAKEGRSAAAASDPTVARPHLQRRRECVAASCDRVSGNHTHPAGVALGRRVRGRPSHPVEECSATRAGSIFLAWG